MLGQQLMTEEGPTHHDHATLRYALGRLHLLGGAYLVHHHHLQRGKEGASQWVGGSMQQGGRCGAAALAKEGPGAVTTGHGMSHRQVRPPAAAQPFRATPC
ncbi:hypothetical protein ABPG75_012624 [Micractinium tetrahymenae]